jgi:hypothetical protein
MYYGFGCDAGATDALMARIRETAPLYDVIVVLPWGALPLHDDRIRAANPWLQLHYQTVIEGVLARWAERTVAMPAGYTDLSDRVARVLAVLPAA